MTRSSDVVAAIVGPALLLTLLGGGAAGLQQADLLARILAAEDEPVHFEYRVREGVELCRGGGLRIGDRSRSVHRTRWSEGERCGPGPAVVRLELRHGRLRGVELESGRRSGRPAPDARSLGRVPAAAAADAILALARQTRDGDAVEEALVAALVADSATVWPRFLEMARDPDTPRGVRKAAVFWTGQLAAERAVGELQDIAVLDDGDLEVREAAIFSLSQLPPEVAVPALIEVARTATVPTLRRSAFFWLAQADHPGVTEYFREVLEAGGASR